MRISHGAFLIGLLWVSLQAVAAPVNLAPNPGFEAAEGGDLPDGWQRETAGTPQVGFARDTTVAHTGAASARLTRPATDHPSWPALETQFAVQPGQCYRLEVWLKTRAVDRLAYLAADYLTATGARLAFTAGPGASGTTDWRLVVCHAVIPNGAVGMKLRLILYGAGTAWFDDLRVTRDERAEQMHQLLAQPLAEEAVRRAVVSEGDLRPLQRLMQAAAQGGEYTVGVLGGSITQGASASGVEQRYPAYVVQWLREHFPQAKFTLVNAGIGATGSDYGCLRVGRDLLVHQPALVIVEYAVNDSPGQEPVETYEGVVRQILSSPRRPAVLQLYFMTQSGSNAQEWQRRVGAQYQLPQVSYRDLLWPRIEAGELTWSDISPDTVHPNDIGHGLAGKLVNVILERALATLPPTPVSTPEDLPAPIFTDRYQHTTLQEADQLQPVSNTGWTYDPAQGWDKCFRSDRPGSVIEFEVTGEVLFLSYWRIKGPMGQAKVSVDGGPPTVCEGWFDQTWGGYRQMIRLPLAGPGRHRVRLELSTEKAAESTGHEFRILCLGTAGR